MPVKRPPLPRCPWCKGRHNPSQAGKPVDECTCPSAMRDTTYRVDDRKGGYRLARPGDRRTRE